jgi:hypothetical protein
VNYLLQYKEKGKDWVTCCKLADVFLRKKLLDCLQEIGLEVREIPDSQTSIKVI